MTISVPHPTPLPAVNPTCTVCGSAVYCGGPLCPSSTLQLSPDSLSMVSTPYISVATKYVQNNLVNNVKAGFRGPGA